LLPRAGPRVYGKTEAFFGPSCGVETLLERQHNEHIVL
jgi:hypothetical protein